MDIIGLTGGTGSGKSVVSLELKKRDSFIIDCDKIAHDIILKGEPAYNEIVEFFGDNIIDENGQIIRKKLGEIVFSDSEKLKFLNKCTHKHIGDEVKRQIEFAKNSNVYKSVIIDAPLLIEAGLTDICDKIWVVYCDESVRADRIVARDGISKDLALKRIASQKSWSEYKKYADVIIDNSSDLNSVIEQIDKILK